MVSIVVTVILAAALLTLAVVFRPERADYILHQCFYLEHNSRSIFIDLENQNLFSRLENLFCNNSTCQFVDHYDCFVTYPRLELENVFAPYIVPRNLPGYRSTINGEPAVRIKSLMTTWWINSEGIPVQYKDEKGRVTAFEQYRPAKPSDYVIDDYCLRRGQASQFVVKTVDNYQIAANLKLNLLYNEKQGIVCEENGYDVIETCSSTPGQCNSSVFELVKIPPNAKYSSSREFDGFSSRCWVYGEKEWCEMNGYLTSIPLQDGLNVSSNAVIYQQHTKQELENLLNFDTYCPIKGRYSFKYEDNSFAIDPSRNYWFDSQFDSSMYGSLCINNTIYRLTEDECVLTSTANCTDHWMFSWARVSDAHRGGNVPCGVEGHRERCTEFYNDQWVWYENERGIVLSGCKKYPKWECKEFYDYRRLSFDAFERICFDK
ncbi:hypothetical protein RCL1_008143 [Eukaryota sp. TZLM3-RCL]